MTPFQSLKMPCNQHLEDLLFRSADGYPLHRTSAENVSRRIHLSICSSTTSLALKLLSAFPILLIYVTTTSAFLRAISRIRFYYLYPVKLLQAFQLLSDDPFPEPA